MSEVLTQNEINQLLTAIGVPPEEVDEEKETLYQEMYLLLKDKKPFTYTEDDDMKNCIEIFLDDWLSEYRELKREGKSMPRIISETSGRLLNDVIHNYPLMMQMYEFHMSSYTMGALQEKHITNARLNKIIRGGLLRDDES